MNSEAKYFGDLPPILAGGARRPDKRRVSKRWLTSTFLVGVTSISLMGGALFVALDGRQELTVPARPAQESPLANSADVDIFKGDRIVQLAEEPSAPLSDIMMVSTLTKSADENVIKMRPFMHASAPLSVAPSPNYEYPPFDPLLVFAESSDTIIQSKSSDLIYGAEVESEVTLKTYPFEPEKAFVFTHQSQQIADIEDLVRRNLVNISAGGTQISSVTYFDEERFSQTDTPFIATPGITITPENVSLLSRNDPASFEGIRFDERKVPILSKAPISVILQTEGMDEAEAGLVEEVLSADLGSRSLLADDTLHMTYEVMEKGGELISKSVAKLSAFRGPNHLVSIARSDDGRFVYAKPPEIGEVAKQRKVTKPRVANSNLPSAYDGIYRAALSEGIPAKLAGLIVKIAAFDVDFKTRIAPNDRLEAFLSIEEGQTQPTPDSEILYVGLTTNGVERKYYRFRDAETGRVDYYDEEGKSSKKFLLRQPVPNGRFNSPFGWRRHPVLRYKRMHWGVDWAAPHGTKILAAGNGVVESAGWAGGNGRRIKINHANGYQTSYSHMRAFAKGIKTGVRVRQGQLIGYVGTSGLSTGPHLHYEVSVNGTRVNPMKIRLPQGKSLKGNELAQFLAERDRINDLLEKRAEQIDLALAE